MATRNISFRCYFPSATGPEYNTHYRVMETEDIPKWLDAYQFTHPDVLSISCKVWFNDSGEQQFENCDDERVE